MEAAPIGSNPQPEKRTGIGLPNIHMRIQLIYGAPYGLSISSGPEGTCVCAEFPIIPEAGAQVSV